LIFEFDKEYFFIGYNHHPNKIKKTSTITTKKFDKKSSFMILPRPKGRLTQREQGLAAGCRF
jgi:hypothetical protein